MKKFLIIVSLLLVVSKLSTAQKVNITGSVKDAHNNPIPLASVTTGNNKTGVAADGDGNFSLSVLPNTTLHISALGYKDTVINVQSATILNVVLQPAENYLSNVEVTTSQNKLESQFNEQLKNEIVQAEFLHYKTENDISSSGINVYEGSTPTGGHYHIVNTGATSHWYMGSALPEFHIREDTKGSIYMFNSWLRGIIAHAEDSSIVDDNKNLYNINKITGDVIMTRDFNTALTLDKTQIRFFTLFDSLKNSYTYMIVPAIDEKLFCEVIALGDGFDIFKLTTTKFVKANFHSDGVMSTGNNYDEYVDTDAYYLLNVQNNELVKFDLKKKSIKQVFGAVPKANDFFTAHKEDIDDAYLKNLGNYINGN
jgi:hypothetical protein